MKTRPQRFSSQRGSTLVTAAFAAGILAIAMGSFASYLSNEYLTNLRSCIWNGALHLAEAGIEVGYVELNYQYYQSNGSGFTSDRGWSSSSGVYSKTVTNFTDTSGNAIGSFTITISGVCMAGCNPTITSVATCSTTPHGPTISRAIKAQLKSVTQWPAGMLSKSWVDMNGNNIYMDSYDSTDPTKSTGGLYDATKKQANGNIASDATVMNSLSIGNANIYGMAYTGAGGSVAMGPNGSLGPTLIDTDRATDVATATANGYIQSDFNVDVGDQNLPSGASTWSGVNNTMTTGPNGGNGNVTKAGTISSGSYRVSGLSLASSEIITINGDVNLYIQGNVSLAGSSQILISSNSSLTVYVSGSVSIAGNGVNNNSLQPIKNKWYGLSTSTSWSMTGNGQWVGAIYAPDAAFSLKGGGTNGDMSGGIVANTITLTGQVQFHYDESLGKADTGAGFACMSWQELKKVSGSWVP